MSRPSTLICSAWRWPATRYLTQCTSSRTAPTASASPAAQAMPRSGLAWRFGGSVTSPDTHHLAPGGTAGHARQQVFTDRRPTVLVYGGLAVLAAAAGLIAQRRAERVSQAITIASAA